MVIVELSSAITTNNHSQQNICQLKYLNSSSLFVIYKFQLSNWCFCLGRIEHFAHSNYDYIMENQYGCQIQNGCSDPRWLTFLRYPRWPPPWENPRWPTFLIIHKISRKMLTFNRGVFPTQNYHWMSFTAHCIDNHRELAHFCLQ